MKWSNNFLYVLPYNTRDCIIHYKHVTLKWKIKSINMDYEKMKRGNWTDMVSKVLAEQSIGLSAKVCHWWTSSSVTCQYTTKNKYYNSWIYKTTVKYIISSFSLHFDFCVLKKVVTACWIFAREAICKDFQAEGTAVSLCPNYPWLKD